MGLRVRDIEELPQEIEVVENTWIPMRDGTRLAARLWRPVDAVDRPVPAILEYIPYRKRDGTRVRDARHHPYFAAHGFAAVRVDLRGSGDSEGVLTDEYLSQELQDGEDVLAWLADQPWCDGNVGMIGISWGGFNGLQLAARRPPALKAVIAVSATDNRYTDDVHYMGGCLLSDNLSWASRMFAYNSLPPDPEIVGSAWRHRWFERLEGSGLWLERWLTHQHLDDYWRHGSIAEDYAAVDVPVMIVSGWADGYSNAVFRTVANLDVPCKGLVGPWSHLYPHLGVPGPAVGFLQEALRWWERWLQGLDNGIDAEPDLLVWMQHAVEPTATYEQRPGHWVSAPTWPVREVEHRAHHLTRGRILEAGETAPAEAEARPISSPLSVGMFGGKWCSYATGPDHPHDQRAEDGGSLVFDSEPLRAPVELLGAPEVDLELDCSHPVAMVAVRLSDIARDDKATRVTYGILNLCHRDGHAEPEPVVPQERMRVRVRLNHCAQRFPAGHRIRLSLSTSYWPLAWPPPEPVRLRVYPERSRLVLPVWRGEARAEAHPAFGASEGTPPIETTVVEPPEHNWVFKRDLGSDETSLEVTDVQGRYRIEEIDLEFGRHDFERYRHTGEDVTTARGETVVRRTLARGDWSVETVGRTTLSCTATEFVVHATLDAYEGGKRVFSRIWDRRVPRDLL